MSVDRALVLLPTLNRTHLVKKFIESYKKTEAKIPVMIMVDNDDYIQNEDQYEDIKKIMPPNWIFKNTGWAVSMGDKTRSVWNDVKAMNLHWIGLLNDDHECLTPYWDVEVDKLIDGRNIVSTNDNFWNFGFNIVGLTAWSMAILETCGFPIFPVGIDHWFIDNIWKAIGESTGCWHETMKVNIAHNHAFIGKMPQDNTYKISQDQIKAQKAMATFQVFMEKEFKDVCEKIMKLRMNDSLDAKFT